jgi:hypothetical protein
MMARATPATTALMPLNKRPNKVTKPDLADDLPLVDTVSLSDLTGKYPDMEVWTQVPQAELNRLRAENERLRTILRIVANCSENDDVAFGQHLCVEQVRVEVGKNGSSISTYSRKSE